MVVDAVCHSSGLVVFVTGVRAAESSAPTVGSMPCTIHPARVFIAPSSVSFADTFPPRGRRGRIDKTLRSLPPRGAVPEAPPAADKGRRGGRLCPPQPKVVDAQGACGHSPQGEGGGVLALLRPSFPFSWTDLAILCVLHSYYVKNSAIFRFPFPPPPYYNGHR